MIALHQNTSVGLTLSGQSFILKTKHHSYHVHGYGEPERPHSAGLDGISNESPEEVDCCISLSGDSHIVM